MLQIALPVLCGLFVWWFSTGLVLYLVTLPRHTHRWSLLGATIATAAALWGLSVSATEATSTGAYVAFTCVISVWGWQEICFLTGVAAGPRMAPCPSGLGGWKRVGAAVQVILYHEIQLLVLGAAVWFATAGGTNQVGIWTYAILWTMRLSAKLNLFFGVPFLHDDWLPAQLRHLPSYFRIRPMNYLFPITVTASSIIVFALAQSALAPNAGPFEITGKLLLASLLALAVLEHWFMVLPLPVAAIWAGFRSRRAGRAAPVEDVAARPDIARVVDQPVVDDAVAARPQQSFPMATPPFFVFPVPTINGGRS
jgi:putative photosynthetic complex assembly protein 2